jgi:hypothetical protein
VVVRASGGDGDELNQQQRAYELALAAVAQIEADLCAAPSGKHNQRMSVVPMRLYRAGSWRLLLELAQLIAAFLADDLTLNGQNVCTQGQHLEIVSPKQRRPRRDRQGA